MQTPYETMFLLPPAMTEDQVDGIVARLKESIEKKHGEVTLVEKMGVRKTAYAVNKLNSAYYVMLQYKGNGETIKEVERLLKNSDEIMKFFSTKVTTKAPIEPKSKKAAAEPGKSPESAGGNESRETVSEGTTTE